MALSNLLLKITNIKVQFLIGYFQHKQQNISPIYSALSIQTNTDSQFCKPINFYININLLILGIVSNMSKKPEHSGFFHSNHGRFSRHQNKKTKKTSSEKDQKQLIEYIDKGQKDPIEMILKTQRLAMPGNYELGVWRKNMGLLTRAHLPFYIKLLDIEQNQSLLIPSKAHINPKKNNKADILIEDPSTQKTRLVKMETFPILLCPTKLVLYKLSFTEFQKVFHSPLFTREDLRKVFNYIVEQCQNPMGQEYLLWPAVVLEGLNYKFEQIIEIAQNFKVNTCESVNYFENMLRIVNQILPNALCSQSNVKADVSELDDKPDPDKLRKQPDQKPKEESMQENSSEPRDKDSSTSLRTESNVCLWLVETAYFTFTTLNMVSWNSLPAETMKKIFSNPLYTGLIKQTNLIIQALNKHKKLQDAELKADEYKYFLHRIGTYKTDQEEALCLPLRFEYVKGVGKRILVKFLRRSGTELKWVPAQSTTVNYTLPNISRKEMVYFYLSKKLSPIDIICTFFYRDFLFLYLKETFQIFRIFFPQFFITQQQALKERCKICNYVLRQMAFKRCFFCQVFCHEECTLQIRKQSTNSFMQEIFPSGEQPPWICQQCQPCALCFEAVGEDFLFCSTCFSYSHFQCGRIKGLENQQKMQHLKINDKFICQFCLKCKMCSHKLKDSEYLIMDNEFYCSECSDKIKSNNHCHVCMKKKEGNSTMKWIQCGDAQCLKWVHQICDPQYIAVVKSPSASDPYLCPLCRQVEMRKIYVEIINSLSVFDQAQFFTEPTYKSIPLYDSIISNPMCFTVMKEKSLQGLYDVNALQCITSDFNLIINNALKFNMPQDPAHVQAKILKVLGEKAISKYSPLFKPQLKHLIAGNVMDEIRTLKLELHREINNHYPQILINYKAERSFIQVRELKKKQNELKPEDEIKFSSVFILNNLFKSSTIVFHLKKQKIGIANLFTMPKSQNERGVWHSIKGDLCYYHNSKDIIFSCTQCCESYCCMRECIRHRTCTVCGQKGCKCDNYECDCPPLKEKQRKLIQAKLFQKYTEPLNTYRQILMDLTENFKYCLKCAQQKIPHRICASCEGLCSWGYFRCPDCSRVWHKKCYPYKFSTNFVAGAYSSTILQNRHPGQTVEQGMALGVYGGRSSNLVNEKLVQNTTCQAIYCRDCLSQKHLNNYQQILTLESKTRLVKIAKITRYMRIFVQVYFNEGIRLTPFEIQQLILENYDQFSIREQLFKQYQLNYAIIERFRDFSFKTNAAIERSCGEYLNDYAELKKSKFIHHIQNVQILESDEVQCHFVNADRYLERCRSIWWKYFRFLGSGLYDFNQDSQWFPLRTDADSPLLRLNALKGLCLQKISEVRQKLIAEAYTYKDLNSHYYQVLRQKSNVMKLLQTKCCQVRKKQELVEKIVEGCRQQQNESFISQKEYQGYLQSLSYISTMDESYYKKDHHYRFTLIYHPRSMPFQYRLNPTFKKKSNLESATKQFLLGIYEENKYCLRKGRTCILREHNSHKDSKDYWSVLKKSSKSGREMLITLLKKNGRWYLRIDKDYERIVNQVEDIIGEINKRNQQAKISSFKELGQFLGFTIFQPFYKANHFTNFLQTNLVDQMPLIDKMNRITELYSSFTWGQNAIFSKSGPASLATNVVPIEQQGHQKTIVYEYSMNKIKPFYLTKKERRNNLKMNKKMEKRLSNCEIEINSQNNTGGTEVNTKRQSYITFQDIKRFLVDYSVPTQAKVEISLKNNPILNEVFIAPSKIHKLGLFSRRFIKKHSIIIEYVGEIVSESVADLREKKFHYGCYLFGIMKQPNRENQDKKDIIDATFRGNMARYLNHSCDPNCKAKIEYMGGSPRIIIYTIRDIQQFEEITYDYQFNVDAVEKLECSCGAKNCQGRLN